MSLIKKVGRKIIYRLIKKSPLIMRIYIKKYNRFPRKTNAVNMSGIKIRHNQVILNGKIMCFVEWIALYKIISL